MSELDVLSALDGGLLLLITCTEASVVEASSMVAFCISFFCSVVSCYVGMLLCHSLQTRAH